MTRLLTIIAFLLLANDVFAQGSATFDSLVVRPPSGRGQFTADGNETAIESFVQDPAKARVASPIGVASCFNLSALQAPGDHQIVAELCCKADVALGGECWFDIRRPGFSDADAAMWRVWRVRTNTSDGMPVMRINVPIEGVVIGDDEDEEEDDPPPPPPPPGLDVPHALLSMTNATGELYALRVIGDQSWISATSHGLDVTVNAGITVTAPGTLRVELRRTMAGDPPPYAYVSIDGATAWGGPFAWSENVIEMPIAAGEHVVQVLCSAQNGGTCHVGGIVVRR